LKVDALPLGM